MKWTSCRGQCGVKYIVFVLPFITVTAETIWSQPQWGAQAVTALTPSKGQEKTLNYPGRNPEDLSPAGSSAPSGMGRAP